MKVITLLLCLSLSLEGLAQPVVEELSAAEHEFQSNPSVYSNYEKLSRLLTTHYSSLNKGQRNSIRFLLAGKSGFPRIVLYTRSEIGERLVIHGKVVDGSGKPIAGAQVEVYQTDARGYYAPPDSISGRMSESDARLYGAMRTNSLGQFELVTIRPGSYPKPYKGRFIPGHIHVNISSPGFKELRLQMVMDDDPVMKDQFWKDWAVSLEFPVVRLIMKDGVKAGDVQLSMTHP